jgi:hypothetical protein
MASTSLHSSLGTLKVVPERGVAKLRCPSGEKVMGTVRMGAVVHTSSSSVQPKQERA